jgi:hypothetical protein
VTVTLGWDSDEDQSEYDVPGALISRLRSPRTDILPLAPAADRSLKQIPLIALGKSEHTNSYTRIPEDASWECCRCEQKRLHGDREHVCVTKGGDVWGSNGGMVTLGVGPGLAGQK